MDLLRFARKINDRGTVTLPAEIREVYGIQDGDIVELEVIRVAKRRQDPTIEPEVTA